MLLEHRSKDKKKQKKNILNSIIKCKAPSIDVWWITKQPQDHKNKENNQDHRLGKSAIICMCNDVRTMYEWLGDNNEQDPYINYQTFFVM